MKRVTQRQKIETHLTEKGWITSAQAIFMFGCTRLASVIHGLRRRGWDIETVMLPTSDGYGKYARYNNNNFKKDEQ